MTTVAILCSGQGFQGPGMFDRVAGADAARPVFAAAARILGQDPRDLVRRGEPAALHANATAQVLCCTGALAAWAALGPHLTARPVVAGYSVGEVAAWGVAEAMDADTVLAAVAERARLMDAATPGPAGLAAVRGLSPDRIAAICRSAGVNVAIRNGPDRVVLGGLRARLDRALAAAWAAGAEAVTPLPVAVPSHTPLLREAAAAFAAYLDARSGDLRPLRARLLSGLDGAAVFDRRAGLAKLARQVAETVDWTACLEACRAAGATRALELGPGAGLSRMMAEALDPRECRSLDDFRTLDGAVEWLTRPAG